MSCRFNHIRAGLTARCGRFGLAVCLVLLLSQVSARGQAAQEGVLLPPPRDGLVPLLKPDTRDMEPEAREHLTSEQNALIATAKDAAKEPGTLADKLGEAYGTMGQVYQAYGLNAQARECYLNASQLAPKDFRWPYLLGKLYEREGDAQRAVGYYNAARSLRPDYLPVFVSLGNIHLQLNRLEEAGDFFKRALALDDGSAAAQYGLGQVALSKRSYAEAVRYLEQALRLAPGANRLHYALAMAYRGLGELAQAQSHLSQSGTVGVRASDPLLDGLQDLARGVRLHLIRGRAALEARRFAEAVDEFRKAIAEQPRSITAHFNLGAALTQTGDFAGAIREFEETLQLDPQHPNAHYNLGLLLARADRHDESIKHLRSAVIALPGDTAARFLLAQELSKAGRAEEAAAELSKVLQSEADNEEALLWLVKILLAGKQYAQALSLLEKGHAQFPQKGQTAVTLAYLLAAAPQVELRDGKRALELARRAYEATGAVAHGALVAMALAELGRCDEAADWQRRMMSKAATEAQPDVVAKLKAELNRYERERPCRPAADISFSDQSPVR